MKKRKMEAEGGVEDGTHSNGDRSSVATVNDSSMSTVVPASSSAALSSEEGAQMEDINYNNSEVDEGEGKDAVSHDAAGGGSSLSPELIQTLLSQLPHALNLLTQLNANLQSAKTPPFHALRKEVLRLAAQLQKSHFDGETRDAVHKRQHHRREKGARLARERTAKTADAKYINSVALRNSRIQALNALMEPEGCGVKIGERMLLPGEDKKLLMAPTSSATPGIVSCSEPSTSPAPSPCPSASSASSISSSSMMEAALVAHPYPTDDAEGMAAAYAAHAGPQSYLYPTISPSSILAQQLIDQGMAAASAESAATTKPFVKQVGKEGGGSGTSEASPPVLIPPLPSPDESPPHALMGGNSNKKNGGGETVSIRTIKKAGLQQEGVVVNAEVLQQNIVREKESEGAAASAAAVPSSSSDPVAPSPSPSSSCSAEFGPTLNSARSCYCCKNRFFQLHFFYSEFCPPCAKLNYAKRNQSADLRGKIILLTGSRVKIGFRCGLKLLRCGATVIATSRFPHDTARRYAEEKDFGEWKERLHIYGLDLRDLKSVVHLSDILCQRYDRLDGIINNAAQTVRRPPAYYRHLMPIECMEVKEMPDQWREVVKGDLHQLAQEQQQSRITSAPAASSSPSSSSSVAAAGVTVEDISHLPSDAHATASSQPHTVSEHPAAAATVAASAAVPSGAAAAAPASSSSLSAFQRNDDLNSALLTTLNRAAALSQLPLLPSDHAHPLEQALFPENRFDVTGQQLDLRSINSWNLNLDQIDPSELVEVFAINALSPFLLNSRLKSLMLRGGSHPVLGPSVQTTDKYIINVSAMEGKFYRHKSAAHPHTNAAKAALNMLTRTSAQDYALSRIYMNSVDTGWINDENPFETAKRLYEKCNFQTPIDEEDAMARILDPLLSGVRTGMNAFGKFFKDYHETEW